MESTRPDQRREAGLRTRARLIDAACDLLAKSGASVTLRDVTDAADANISAVSYHFGSLQSLCDAAVEHALESYLDAQQAAVSELGPESTVEEAAAAFARPMMDAMAAGGRDFAVVRVFARAAIDPPSGWDRLSARFDRPRVALVRVLKVNLPGVSDRELIFRIRCVAGLLNWLALAPVGEELRGRTQKQVERRLVPLLAGSLRGSSP
jgi:AcrR family transcriptional regulator